MREQGYAAWVSACNIIDLLRSVSFMLRIIAESVQLVKICRVFSWKSWMICRVRSGEGGMSKYCTPPHWLTQGLGA